MQLKRKGIKMKDNNKPVRCDLPPHVHDFLKSLHGTKKYNAEAILMAAARKNGFKPQ